MGSSADKMKKILKIFGYSTKDTKLKPIIYILSSIYFFINAIIALIKNWDNIGSRFLAMEDISVLFIVISMCVEYSVIPRNIQTLISISEDDVYEYKYFKSVNRGDILKESIAQEDSLGRSVELVMKLVAPNLCVMPGVLLLFQYFKDESVNVSEYPLPMEYYYTNPSIVRYIVIYSAQVIYTLCFMTMMYCLYNSGIIAMHRTKTEIRLLTAFLGELNQQIFMDTKSFNPEDNLRYYLRDVTCHHQIIYRKIKDLNSSIKFTASLVTQGVCFEACLCLYYCVEMDSVLLKLKYFVILIPILCTLYMYYSNGQDIINEDENLKIAFAECSWVDKPLWFKRSLLFIMIRSTSSIEIRPFGIYVLNLKTFSNVMNAAYSYFNILRTTTR